MKEQGIQLVQNKALRTVYRVKLGKNPRYTTRQMRAKGGCMALNHRRRIHLLHYAYGLQHRFIDIIDKRALPTRRHDGIRYIMQPARKPVFRRALLYRAIEDWNNLKTEYTKCKSFKLFKKLVKSNFPHCYIIPIVLNDT